MEICIWFNGQVVCINIPLLVRLPWDRGPGPEWDKLLNIRGLDHEVMVNVLSLGAIAHYARGLEPALRADVHATVQKSLATITDRSELDFKVEIQGI